MYSAFWYIGKLYLSCWESILYVLLSFISPYVNVLIFFEKVSREPLWTKLGRLWHQCMFFLDSLWWKPDPWRLEYGLDVFGQCYVQLNRHMAVFYDFNPESIHRIREIREGSNSRSKGGSESSRFGFCGGGDINTHCRGGLFPQPRLHICEDREERRFSSPKGFMSDEGFVIGVHKAPGY